MAVAATQAAAGQEKDEADAGAVHGAAGFHGMNQTGDGAFSVRIMVLWKTCGIRLQSGLTGVESAVDDLLLLFPGQLDEIHGIAGNADGKLRVFSG